MKKYFYLALIMLLGSFVPARAQLVEVKGLENLSKISGTQQQIRFLLLQNPQLSEKTAEWIVNARNLQVTNSANEVLKQLHAPAAQPSKFSPTTLYKTVEEGLQVTEPAHVVPIIKQPYRSEWSTGPEMTFVLTKYFIRQNGFFPRSKIEGKAPTDYTEQEIQELKLAGRIRRFLNTAAPTDPLVSAFEQLYETNILPNAKSARVENSRYGMLPRQTFRTTTNRSLDAQDLANDFPQWLAQYGSYILPTPETTKAFETLRTATAGGSLDDTTYEILLTLNNMQLGRSDKDTLVRVAYRGNNPQFPKAKDFHEVVEISGLTRWHPHVQKALQEDYSPIIPYINHDAVAGLILGEGTTAKDVARVLQALCPEGFVVRMTPHEFGIQENIVSDDPFRGKLHLHMESISPSEGEGAGKPDINYSVWINAKALVRGKTPHQIFKLYRDLFRPYMDDFMVNFTL